MATSTKAAPQIEITPSFQEAFDIANDTHHHLFLTGKAGTGKSTFLEYFRENTNKQIVVLAPTGVAAVNVKGQTIHSFFGFKPDITPSKVKKARKDKLSLYTKLDTIVIDEVSMVRADLLDCVDLALRLNRDQAHKPFGGVQMIFIGDLFQLPPVVTRQEQFLFEAQYRSPYFFSSFAFTQIHCEKVELQKIYRQDDDAFISMLNNIRHRSLTNEDIVNFNARHDAEVEIDPESLTVQLVTTNKMAEVENTKMLNQLDGAPWKIKGSLEGDFGDRRLPSPQDLKLKIGAQVMMVANDNQKRWVNGTIGKIVDIKRNDADELAVYVELEDGRTVEVEKYTWEMFKYFYNGDIDSIDTEKTGAYTQFPLTLAWAVTIHKAQGKTFEQVVIDVGNGAFAHGQMYVALSRCTSLEGITLKKPINLRDVIVDQRISTFMEG